VQTDTFAEVQNDNWIFTKFKNALKSFLKLCW